MTTHQLVVYLILLVPVAVCVVALLSVTLVWWLDMFSEDPRPPKHRRQVYSPEPVSPLWVQQLPRAHTPWDVSPLTRAEIQLATILYVVDRLNVPQLRPEWVARTKRQLELEVGL